MSHKLKVNRFSSYRNDQYDLGDKYTRMAARLASKPPESWQQKLMNEAEERDHQKHGGRDRSYTASTLPRDGERWQSDPVRSVLEKLIACGGVQDYSRLLSEANRLLETQGYSFEINGKRASDFFKIYSSLHSTLIYLASKETGDTRFKCLSYAQESAEKAHFVISKYYARPKPELISEWAIKIKEAKEAQLKFVLDELHPAAEASTPEQRCEILGNTADYLEKRAKELGSEIFEGRISELRLEKARLHLSIAKAMIGEDAAINGFLPELEAAESAAKGAMGNNPGLYRPGVSLLLGEILLFRAWRQILDSGPKDEKVSQIFSSIVENFWRNYTTVADTRGANHVPVSGSFYPGTASENLEKFGLGRVRLPEKDGFRYYSSKGGLMAIRKSKENFCIYKLEGQLISDEVRSEIFLAQAKYLHGLALMHAGNRDAATNAFKEAFNSLGGYFAIEMADKAANSSEFSKVEFNPVTGIAVNSGFFKEVSCHSCFSQYRNEEGNAFKTDFKAASSLYGITMELRHSALCAYALLSDNPNIQARINSFDPGNIPTPNFSDPYSEAINAEYRELSTSFWLVHSALAFKKKD